MSWTNVYRLNTEVQPKNIMDTWLLSEVELLRKNVVEIKHVIDIKSLILIELDDKPDRFNWVSATLLENGTTE